MTVCGGSDETTHDDRRLGHRFWRLWSAGVINNLGDGALTIGVGLLATTITRDPRLIAGVSAVSMLPWLLLTLPAGVLIDRVQRIRLIRLAQLLQAGAMAILTVLTAVHQITIPELAVLSFVVTTGNVVSGLASQSVLPQVVAEPLLVKANSLTYVGQTIAYSFLGQSLGGVLFATAAALPFGLETLSYLGSATLLARLTPRSASTGHERRRQHARRRPKPQGAGHVWRDTIEGLRFLARHRLLRTLALVLGVNNFANQMALSILVLFALHDLHVSREQFGWMVAASALGGVLGGLANTHIVRLIGKSTALITALAVNAVCFGLIGVSTTGIEVAALMAAVGFSVTIWNVVSVSMRQTLVPTELLGRVNSVYRLIGWGLLPLGALAGGLLAHWLGTRSPFLTTSTLRTIVLIATAPTLIPALRHPKGNTHHDEASAR